MEGKVIRWCSRPALERKPRLLGALWVLTQSSQGAAAARNETTTQGRVGLQRYQQPEFQDRRSSDSRPPSQRGGWWSGLPWAGSFSPSPRGPREAGPRSRGPLCARQDRREGTANLLEVTHVCF